MIAHVRRQEAPRSFCVSIMPQALQCPRCHGAVTVPDSAAGQRVKCPHCDESFLAPGVAPSANDDDDWLKLDSDPVATDGLPDTPPPPAPTAAPLPNPVSSPAPAATGESNPNLSSEEEALLAEFTSDLDEFTAEIEAPPPPPKAKPLPPAAPFQGLPPMLAGAQPTPAASTEAAPKPPAAQPTEYQTEYRVKCSICGTVLYAKAEQAGKTLKCSDCFSPVTIPEPPRVRKKNEIDLENAETFSLEHTQTAERKDPFQKSAEQLLDEASREEEESDDPKYNDVPSVKEWFKRVFGIFLDPGVLAHWLILSVFAAVPAFLALSMDSPILMLGLFPAGLFLGAIVVCCGFAILQSVANDEESVSEWPVFDPLAWFGQLFVAFSAAFVSAVPAWVVTQLVFQGNLLGVAITMFAIYTIFPFVLLSMLDMQSAFIPFSAEVARSLTKCEEAWGGFYFSSGLLFVGLFLMFTLLSTIAMPVAAVAAIFATIAIAFTYFSMIGRLAYAIGQVVNAPPMKNDIDRGTRTQTRDGSIH